MRNELLVKQVRDLYNQGWSSQEIASELGIRKENVNRWYREISMTKRGNSLMDYYAQKREHFFNLDRLSIDDLTNESAKLYCAILFWCEGGKYPSNTTMQFSSSDPLMQQVFITLLRKGFNLDETKFRIWLQIHDDQNRFELEQFWSKLLNIPLNHFIKTTTTKKKGLKYRRIYKGTCSLRYNDYSIILRLMGIYQRFANNILNQQLC